jgi:hypothetical protein
MSQSISSFVALLLLESVAGGSGLGIFSSMNVRFIVIDPSGRRTGYDPAARTDVQEIPSSRYGEKFTGAVDGGGGDRAREFVAAFGSPDHLIDGPYILRVYGERAGPFWLSISVYREPLSEDFNIRGMIRPGDLKVYRLNYADDLSVPIRIDTLNSEGR